jgi:hypothetical protein
VVQALAQVAAEPLDEWPAARAFEPNQLEAAEFLKPDRRRVGFAQVQQAHAFDSSPNERTKQ